jgi:hypothetical protein
MLDPDPHGNQYGAKTLLRTSKKNTGISEGSLFLASGARPILAVTSPNSGKHYISSETKRGRKAGIKLTVNTYQH